MSLVSIADVRMLVRTSLTDTQLQALIDREEKYVVRYFGAPYVDDDTPVTETLNGARAANLYLRRRAKSIVSVDEVLYLGGTTYRLDPSLYFHWELEGRIQRLPSLAQENALGIPGALWGAVVTVVYVPFDDNEERTDVIIELVRLAIERTAMKSENIAGEYSYSAPEWETERVKILRRLKMDF